RGFVHYSVSESIFSGRIYGRLYTFVRIYPKFRLSYDILCAKRSYREWKNHAGQEVSLFKKNQGRSNPLTSFGDERSRDTKENIPGKSNIGNDFAWSILKIELDSVML